MDQVRAWEKRAVLAAALVALPGGAALAGPGDEDSDGIADGADNCPTVANPGQVDANGDGHGDDCVDPAAVICDSAVLGYGVIVHADVSIGCFAVIGERSELGNPFGPAPATVIEHEVELGARGRVWDSVRVGARTRIGEDALLGFVTDVGTNVRVGDRASVNGTIGAASRLGDDVDLHDTPTVGYGVQIGDRTTVIGPVDVLDFTRIGHDSFVGEGGAHGPWARIGDDVGLPLGASVGAFSVVGDGFGANSTCQIGDYVTIGKNVTFFDVIVHDFGRIGRDSDIRRGIELGHHSTIGHHVTIDLLDVDYPPFTVIPPNTTLP